MDVKAVMTASTNNRDNYRDLNIDQNNRDNNFYHNRAALVLGLRTWAWSPSHTSGGSQNAYSEQ